jgi:hypothetical protein
MRELVSEITTLLAAQAVSVWGLARVLRNNAGVRFIGGAKPAEIPAAHADPRRR